MLLSARVDADRRLVEGSSTARVAWWSFTKTLIAALALRLAEEGVVDLDAPMAGRPFTLRQLLQHRAGLPDYGGVPAYHAAVAAEEAPWSEAELLRRVPPDRLLFEPGHGWRYSNIGYLLVRRALEAATGQGLGALLGERVLGPLGVPQARLAGTREEMAALALPPPHAYDPGWVYHGTIVGPVADAALALHRLLAGDLLRPDSLAAMLARHPIGGPVEDRPWATHGYGLGLMIGEMRGRDGAGGGQAIGHSAGGPGSAGAVYRIAAPHGTATAAVFVPGHSEAPAEFEALRIAGA